jgi:uncharacterized delta-60 repeat protein
MRRFQLCTPLVGLWLALGNSVCCAIVGQPGTLDQSFATASAQGAGKVRTVMSTSDDYVRAAVLQGDGKFLLVGECGSSAGNQVCAARYLPDGSLDPSWGSDGKAFASVGQFGVNVAAAALQSDGALLVAASCQPAGALTQSFCVVRFTSGGALDTAWGSAGLVATEFTARGASAGGIVVGFGDSFYVAGSCTIDFGDTDFCAARFSSAGVLDVTWGVSGKLIARFSNGVDQAKAVLLRTDGKLLLGGSCTLTGRATFCAAQLTALGALDASWGVAGFATATIADNSSAANTAQLMPDGSVLLAGSCFQGTKNGMCSAMFDGMGVLASGWNGVGYAIAPGNGTEANAIVRQSDGKLVLAGGCSTGLSNSFCAWRYTSSGTLDRSFGVDGRSVVNIGLSDGATGLAIQALDARILLGGFCGGGQSVDFCVARLDGGISPDAGCVLDVDGDGELKSTIDSLLQIRIAKGVFAASLTAGVSFAPTAQRTTWEAIREHLRQNPADLDGDGRVLPETDGLLHVRYALGFGGDSALEGITLPSFATRLTWYAITAYIESRCDIAR